MKSILLQLATDINKRSTWIHLAIALVIFTVLAIGFAQLLEEVHEGDTMYLDKIVLQQIGQSITDSWNRFYSIATRFGGTPFITLATIVLLYVLLWQRWYYRAVFMVVNVVGAGVATTAIKLLVGRERPSLWERIVEETSYSFPSGHAVGSMALAISLVVICWPTRWRWSVVIFSTLYVLIIGYSRLYLGVHYPTDVIGGWLLALAWAMTSGSLLYGYGRRRRYG
ncbi:MAG: phosphatase PAP2 family protein [Candidatus Saccharimonadales bacterium]